MAIKTEVLRGQRVQRFHLLHFFSTSSTLFRPRGFTATVNPDGLSF